MDIDQDTPEQVSEYPDPEESGLSFPWLDQYHPVPAETFSTRPQPIVHEGFVPQDDGSMMTSVYGLRNRRRSSLLLPEEGFPGQNAVLENSGDDSEFLASDVEAE